MSATNLYGESVKSDGVNVTTGSGGGSTVNVHKNNHAYLAMNRYYEGDDKNIIDTVNKLKSKSIKYQFIDLGLIDSETGHMEEGIQDLLAHYIEVSKATDPEQKIIAVINCDNRDVFLNSTSSKNTLRSEICHVPILLIPAVGYCAILPGVITAGLSEVHL